MAIPMKFYSLWKEEESQEAKAVLKTMIQNREVSSLDLNILCAFIQK